MAAFFVSIDLFDYVSCYVVFRSVEMQFFFIDFKFIESAEYLSFVLCSTKKNRTCCYSYRENAQSLSRIYRDQPLTPLQQAVYWTEYVIRHKGAPHLRSAVLDLAWYQYFLLDVIAVLALVVVCLLVAVYFISRSVIRRLTLCDY